jgi:hypothetical protein
MFGEAAKTQNYITKIRGERLDINMENPNTNPKNYQSFQNNLLSLAYLYNFLNTSSPGPRGLLPMRLERTKSRIIPG